MFVDVAKIIVKAGDGGNGAVSFHREKYIAAGGPDGGDGGKGGDIVFVADSNISTLADFRYKRKYTAENGYTGGASRSYGKGGEDLIIKVPFGTLIKDSETGRILADLSDDSKKIIAKGGRGGFGNAHFATPVRQAPRFAKPGAPGESFEVTLELKLLADVGLVGYPNVGKSTLISVVSEAKPVIANYHFTTITPVLGVVRVDEGASFVMADIPGLIEGAKEGAGLGHQFLRHIERCRLFVHIVDVSGNEGRDPVQDFETINHELYSYNPELKTRPMIVAGNKCDLATDEQLQAFEAYVTGKGYEYYPIMAAIAHGTKELMNKIAAEISKLPPVKHYEAEPAPAEDYESGARRFTVTENDGVYIVEGEWLLKVISQVNFNDYESLQYFQRVLIKSGIIDALKEKGIKEGDTVSIYDLEFDFVP